MQLGFGKTHHQISLEENVDVAHELGELPEIWGFPFNISATAEASDFKFGTQLRFAKAYHKITTRGKSGSGLGIGELPKMLGFPIIFLQQMGLGTSNLVHNLGLPRPTIKPHPEKSGRNLGLGKLPNIWGSPLIFLQRPRCPLSVSEAACINPSAIGTHV